jgi:hypothetical protein
MKNKIIDIGFIIVNKELETNNVFEGFKLCRANYLETIDNYSFNKEEANLFFPFYDEDKINSLRIIQKSKILKEDLTKDEMISYSTYYNTTPPMNKYFYLQPSIFLNESDFQNLSDNSILKKIYYDDDISDQFLITNIKKAYESIVIPQKMKDLFIQQIKEINTDSLLGETLDSYKSNQTIIIQKVL